MITLREAALEALQQGPATYPELEKRTGRQDTSLKGALYALEKDGVVRREKIVNVGRFRRDLVRLPRVRWMLTGQPDPEQERRRPVQKLILENMWDGCSITELAEEMDTPKWPVYHALRRLEARGVVRSEPVDRSAVAGDKRRQPRVRWYRV